MVSLIAVLLAGAYAVQPPGEFHAGEAVARDGEAWLALQVEADAATLRPVTVRTLAWHDAVVDEPDARTGTRVSVEGPTPLVLLRGPGLGEGGIERATFERERGADGEPSALPHYRLRFRGQDYRIHTACSVAGGAAAAPKRVCSIVLHTPGTAQTLARMPAGGSGASLQLGDDASPALLFAGDLDRDGRLDLLFNLTDHYNLSRTVLLLSSAAGDGEAVAEVARLDSVGC